MNWFVSGIQQVGVGCENFEASWKWYIDMFGMDVRALEDDTMAERMLRYTGGKPQRRHACVALNLQGGGGLEIWQYSDRPPQPRDFDLNVGDLGVFLARLKTSDARKFREELSGKYDKVGPLGFLPDGTPCFTVEDPWGNWFQAVEQKDVFIRRKSLCGGICGAAVGCTDIDRALSLYSDLLGYDIVVYDRTGDFEDLKWMYGGSGHFRRVLLTHSEKRKGAFAEFYGRSSIELVQALDRQPRRIYEGRCWGDPGFIQLCFDVSGMRKLEKAFAGNGYPFTIDSCPDGERFDMGEAGGHFVYVEDPDGTLIELVEAHCITICKRPRIRIDLLKRNPEKPLPKLMFRLMGLKKVKF